MFNWSSCAYVLVSQRCILSSLNPTAIFRRRDYGIEIILLRLLSLSLIGFSPSLSGSCHDPLEIMEFLF